MTDKRRGTSAKRQERRRAPLSPVSRPASSLLFAIDVGNTHITIGVFHGDKLLRTWRLHTNRHATTDELGLLLSGLLKQATRHTDWVSGVVLASVVPALDTPLIQACWNYLHQKPVVVGDGAKLGIRNLYKNPEEVGADRLVNAVAVHHLLKGSAIVVDFGTATTFDCVSAKGEYLGGAICPGLELAGEWLATHTAKLPRITFQAAPSRPWAGPQKKACKAGFSGDT
jgi:type III pantothenate kinase